jgi:hypothetical protein
LVQRHLISGLFLAWDKLQVLELSRPVGMPLRIRQWVATMKSRGPGDFWESGIPEDRDGELASGTFRVGLAAANSTFHEDVVCGVSNSDAQSD